MMITPRPSRPCSFIVTCATPLHQFPPALSNRFQYSFISLPHNTQNPLSHAIKEHTATADQVDAAFESHITAFLAKKNGPKDLARLDLEEKKPSEVKKTSIIAATVYHEPYYAATSSGLGTLGARANSVDAGLAYCQKVKKRTAAAGAAQN